MLERANPKISATNQIQTQKAFPDDAASRPGLTTHRQREATNSRDTSHYVLTF
jgi:hypothetical protein